jgi:hypothetical protein
MEATAGIGSGRTGVDARQFQAWRVRALSLLERTVGLNDPYTRSFVERCTDSWAHDAAAGVAIIESFRADVAAGYLTRFSNLVAASVFSDFFEMAEHLIQEGFKDPAASLIGAVLEDGLRTIATTNGVTVTKADGLDSLNQKCTDAGVYGPLQRSQVNSARIVRNAADHGKFTEYSISDVSAMLRTAQEILGAHLT